LSDRKVPQATKNAIAGVWRGLHRRLRGAALAGALGLAGAVGVSGVAAAHPHVWVDVRSELIFNGKGEVTAVRHAWTFDDMYSAFALQGLGSDGVPIADALKALAQVNVSQLAEYGYFTALSAGGRPQKFSGARDYNITMNEKRIITLHFTADLERPAPARPAAILRVFDPTYFVAFDYAKDEPVTMNQAPQGCSLSMITPKPLSVMDQTRLLAVQGTGDSPGENFGLKLATSAIAACP